MDLTDRWFAITGGAGGIGVATAAALLRAGGRVLLIDVAEDRLQAAARTLGAEGRVVTWRSTLADPANCAEALASVPDPFHGLVHLAGLFEPDPMSATDHGVWDRAIAHNLTNAYDMAIAFQARHAVPARIVFASSIAYRRGSAGRAAYSAAKGGVVGPDPSAVAAIGAGRAGERGRTRRDRDGDDDGGDREQWPGLPVEHPARALRARGGGGGGDCLPVLGRRVLCNRANDHDRWRDDERLSRLLHQQAGVIR
jgi:hypothetical protein